MSVVVDAQVHLVYIIFCRKGHQLPRGNIRGDQNRVFRDGRNGQPFQIWAEFLSKLGIFQDIRLFSQLSQSAAESRRTADGVAVGTAVS